tara:strand:+ start:83 stop:367 length:285 start_codon:yes stop_codon:yes gene_type:complete
MEELFTALQSALPNPTPCNSPVNKRRRVIKERFSKITYADKSVEILQLDTFKLSDIKHLLKSTEITLVLKNSEITIFKNNTGDFFECDSKNFID